MAHLLWVDDEVDSADPSVRLLATAGYRVECAMTAAEAIRKAGARPYHVMIVDLRLPDATGLDVLRAVRARGVKAPVLMLSGFGTVRDTVSAMRLGAADFMEKPLLGDELVAAVRSIHVPVDTPASFPTADGSVHDGSACGPLCDALAAWSLHDGERASSERLLAALVIAISAPSLDLGDFLALAQAVRVCVDGRSAPPAETAARVRAAGMDTFPRLTHAQRQILALLREVDWCNAGRLRLCDKVLQAMMPGVDLESFLRSRTPLGLGQWRSVLAIRHAVALLHRGETPVKQIAWDVGFDHASQFDREFVRFLGVTPSEFRHILRGAATSESGG